LDLYGWMTNRNVQCGMGVVRGTKSVLVNLEKAISFHGLREGASRATVQASHTKDPVKSMETIA
jgi:hypothetical protein